MGKKYGVEVTVFCQPGQKWVEISQRGDTNQAITTRSCGNCAAAEKVLDEMKERKCSIRHITEVMRGWRPQVRHLILCNNERDYFGPDAFEAGEVQIDLCSARSIHI